MQCLFSAPQYQRRLLSLLCFALNVPTWCFGVALVYYSSSPRAEPTLSLSIVQWSESHHTKTRGRGSQ